MCVLLGEGRGGEEKSVTSDGQNESYLDRQVSPLEVKKNKSWAPLTENLIEKC